MAMQQEILKTAAAAVLVLLHVAGVTILPTATVVAVCFVQLASLAGELVDMQAQPSKAEKVHSLSLAERFSASVNYTLVNFGILWCMKCGAGVLTILMFGAFSRLAGLGRSPFQVILLACLFGGAAQFLSTVAALCAGSCSPSTEACPSEKACCPYQSDFWPRPEEDQEDDVDAPTQWMVEEEPLMAQLMSQYFKNTGASLAVEPFAEDESLLAPLECFANED